MAGARAFEGQAKELALHSVNNGSVDRIQSPVLKLHSLQKLTRGALNWLNPTATMIVWTSYVRFRELAPLDPDRFLGVYPLTAIAWTVAMETSKIGTALTTEADPIRGLRAAGNGSAARGLAKEVVKDGVILGLIAGGWTLLNYLYATNYSDWTSSIENMEKYQYPIIVCSYLNADATRNAIQAAVTGVFYVGIPTGVSYVVAKCRHRNLPQVAPESGHPDTTSVIQKLGHASMRTYYGVMYMRLIPEMMNSIVGGAAFLHIPDAEVFGMPFWFLIQDTLDYYSRIPNAISQLDIPCAGDNRKRNRDGYDLVPGRKELRVAIPKWRNTLGVTIRLLLILMILALIFGLNRLLMPLIERSCDPVSDPMNRTKGDGRVMLLDDNGTVVANVTDLEPTQPPCQPDPANLNVGIQFALQAGYSILAIGLQKIALVSLDRLGNIGRGAGLYSSRSPAPTTSSIDESFTPASEVEKMIKQDEDAGSEQSVSPRNP